MEILAIVAHELGHWAHMDILKGMASSLIRIYVIFFAFSYSLEYTNMPADFGFKDKSVYVSLMLFFMLLEPLMEVLSIQQVAMVRRMEFNADKYSIEKGYGLALRDGLIAIHVNNQANLNPDWLYALLKFDHPALIERLTAID